MVKGAKRVKARGKKERGKKRDAGKGKVLLAVGVEALLGTGALYSMSYRQRNYQRK